MRQKRVKVLFSYSPQNSDELELKTGDVIHVLEVVEEGWWRGKLKGKVGVFPSNFVQETPDDASDDGMAGHGSSSEDLDADAPDGQGSSSSKSRSKSESCEDFRDPDVIKPKQVIGVPTAIRFGANLKTVLKPVEDRGKPLPKKPPPPAPASTDADPAPRLPPKPAAKEQAKVLFPYDAQNDDELTIKEGDIINVISKEVEDVGWWKGEINGRVGVFPDNFVQLIKDEVVKTPKKMDTTGKPGATSSPIMSSTAAKGDETPKGSPGGGGPLIPSKKPKVASKPDVVPQESLSKDEPSEGNNAPDADVQFAHLDSNSSVNSKLTHLTANRAKGPKDRRPPSLVGLPKDIGNGFKENGELGLGKGGLVSSTPELTKASPQVPPQWMLELRKNQEEKSKRRLTAKGDDSPGDSKPTTGPPLSPSKISPNRFSGDFGAPRVGDESPDTSSSSGPVSILKPLKPAKPGSNHGTAKIKPEENKELTELQKEIRILKESVVAKKDFDDLVKKVHELREVVETQKQSYGSLIKDLINDIAEERKKLATLQIEVDRLRKLTTTV